MFDKICRKELNDEISASNIWSSLSCRVIVVCSSCGRRVVVACSSRARRVVVAWSSRGHHLVIVNEISYLYNVDHIPMSTLPKAFYIKENAETRLFSIENRFE